MDEARGGGCYDLRTVSYIIFIIAFVFLFLINLFWNAIPEEKKSESITPYFNNYISWKGTSNPIIVVNALNGSDYSNSTITINRSHIQETREDNGTLIIEIRKDVIK